MRNAPGRDGKCNPDRACKSCPNKGHWKEECPIRNIDPTVYVKSTSVVKKFEPSVVLIAQPALFCEKD